MAPTALRGSTQPHSRHHEGSAGGAGQRETGRLRPRRDATGSHMQFSRRRFIGAALVAAAGVTTASCVTAPSKVALPEPALPPRADGPPPQAQAEPEAALRA